jgi:oligopeptide/dipeptide ABC transporter ATP-binding protein
MTEGNGAVPLVRVRDLEIQFPTRRGIVHAVNGVDLEVPRGKAVGIVGESGSGKSVTVMAIARLLDPGAQVVGGSIEFDGADAMNDDPGFLRNYHGRRVGVVFQNPLTSLDPLFTIGDQITEGPRFHAREQERASRVVAREIRRGLNIDRRGAHWRDTAERLLDRVRIRDPQRVAAAYPFELSGGMRQRAVIASAVALEPQLLIADEPTTALDVTVQAEILALLQDLRERTGASLLMVTHDLSIVAEHCDTVYVMYAGRVVERGPSRRLFTKPQHPYTSGLLAAIPSLDGPRRELRGIAGGPPDPLRAPVGCPLVDRCERALDRCRSEFPSETTTGDGHSVWCHNPR